MTHMEIHALSKEKFDKIVKSLSINENNVEMFGNKFFISISHSTVFDDADSMEGDWIPLFKENKKNVLCLLFDDVVADMGPGIKAFTKKQAEEVINFLKQINKKTSELFVHCAMGSSRSVAVAEFAREIFGEKFINARIDRSPNKHVLNTLREKWES